MRAYECGDYGATGLLTLVDRPDPTPGPGQAVIRVRATGPNARDFAIMSGNQFGNLTKPSLIPLSDNAGDVLSIGAGVTHVKPGDRVTMTHYWQWLDGAWDESMRHEDYAHTLDGFLAEQALIPAAALLPIPDAMTYEDASTLQSAGLTAWNAVVEAGRTRPGDTVVTIGTGGVSVFAMQWAKMLGARVIVTSSDDAKLKRMLDLGADDVVNYRTNPEWSKAVMELTGGRGADVVINNVGMSELDQCLESAASGGRIMYIGSNSVAPGRQNSKPEPLKRLGLLIMRDLNLKGVIVGSRKMFVDMVAAMEKHSIKPVIERVYEFEQANEALAYTAGAQKIGKVVIRVG